MTASHRENIQKWLISNYGLQAGCEPQSPEPQQGAPQQIHSRLEIYWLSAPPIPGFGSEKEDRRQEGRRGAHTSGLRETTFLLRIRRKPTMSPVPERNFLEPFPPFAHFSCFSHYPALSSRNPALGFMWC